MKPFYLLDSINKVFIQFMIQVSDLICICLFLYHILDDTY